MLKPAEIAPASGPTITADAALLRDRTTGRFAPTDGRGRSAAEREAIADRWARVAELYPHKTEREIAEELEWSPATIAKDVRALAALGIIEQIRQPGARRKYPDAKERPCDGCGKLFTPEN